jgi:hypothetical protein
MKVRWKLVKIINVRDIIAMMNGIKGIIFALGGVRAETVPALARRIDAGVFVVSRQCFELSEKYCFESSGKLHYYLQRKPIRQLHLKKGFMATTDMEVTGIIVSEDFEELPTNWTAEP